MKLACALCHPQTHLKRRSRITGAVTVEWHRRDGNLLRLNAHLALTPAGDFPMTAGRELWLEGRYRERGVSEPWTVQWKMIGG